MTIDRFVLGNVVVCLVDIIECGGDVNIYYEYSKEYIVTEYNLEFVNKCHHCFKLKGG